MAARWGTGEEILKACNMEFFSTASLDEADILQGGLCNLQHHGLDTGDTLEALQSCLDPSILSIFEHSPTVETKHGVDEERATLLSALTDILDNVDDENLSPFDSLPDAELFQGQKGQEPSSLRKLLSFSLSSPEKESVLNSRQFSGKTLPSTGSMDMYNVVEDDGISSLLVQDLVESSVDELDWCLPISLEKDGECVSVTLSELVRHIHPFSMTVCMEGEEEQLLPDGGIVLEVVDKGENGEAILAIPDLNLPLSVCNGDPTVEQQQVPENSPDKTELEPEESLLSETPLVVKDKAENVVVKPPKIESLKRCSSKGKKKGKRKQSLVVEERVLRSSSSKKSVEVSIEEPVKEQKKKKKVTFAPVLTVAKPEVCKVEKSLEMKTAEAQITKENTSVLIATTVAPQVSAREPCAEVIVSKTLPIPAVKPIPTELPLEKCEEAGVSSKEEPPVSQPSEPKPKSISLQQYRLLRQHKKPSLPEKIAENCTKWPLLPEAPKELLPIPCLPAFTPREPHRSAPLPAKKEPGTEVMPAWKPRGPTAPPTPEALLVPPASMLASSRKPEPPKVASAPPSKPAENSATLTSLKMPSNHQELPITTNVPQNTTPGKVSSAAKRTPLEIPASLPVLSTNGSLPHAHAAGQAKSLQDTPSTFHHVVKVVSSLPTKNQDICKPQARTEITARATTNVRTFNAISEEPKAAMPLTRGIEQAVEAPVPGPAKPTLPVRSAVCSQRHVAPIAAQPFTSAPIQARIVKLAEQMRIASAPVPKSKCPTAELIESFTSEIGIEAADLTSLLEQFEETQPKEEQTEPEVCGRAATVGNSSMELQAETKAVKKASSPDLGSTAGLTPPATPPHQIWKPLAPVALLGKPKKSEVPKQSATKAIQIEPRPLTTGKQPKRPQPSGALGPTQPFSLDHDYCLLPKEPSRNELGNRWNIKQQPGIVIKSVELSINKTPQQSDFQLAPTPPAAGNLKKNLKASQPPVHETQSEMKHSTHSIMVTPDASPDRMDSECSLQDAASNKRQHFEAYSERSPSPYHHKRGRSQRTYRTRSCSSSGSRSSSSESSRSRSPPRKRYRSGRSRSNSRSPPRYRSRSRSLSPPRRRRYSYSSSCSGSWSQSRSRSRSSSHSRSPSRSPARRLRHWNAYCSPSQRSSYRCSSRENDEETRQCKEKAIEERRVVYVGRINGGMTRKELRERFSYFGEIEDCTVHFREQGDNYGFVTYYNTKDAFHAIENGSKIRQPNELPFDLCFGGRRQFCRMGYADLDSNQDFDPAPVKRKFDALDFDTLLKQAQRNLKR